MLVQHNYEDFYTNQDNNISSKESYIIYIYTCIFPIHSHSKPMLLFLCDNFYKVIVFLKTTISLCYICSLRKEEKKNKEKE